MTLRELLQTLDQVMFYLVVMALVIDGFLFMLIMERKDVAVVALLYFVLKLMR